MGIFGNAGSSKTDLIRALLTERLIHDASAIVHGYTPFMVRELTGMQIMGTPEADIVTIVETHAKLLCKGVSDLDAINQIEAHRVSLGRGLGGPPSNLSDFIHYRVGLEERGPGLAESHIDLCIEAADHFFTYVDDRGEATNSLKFAQLQQKTKNLERLLTELSSYISGETSHEEFWGLMEDDVLAWNEKVKAKAARVATFRLKTALRDM